MLAAGAAAIVAARRRRNRRDAADVPVWTAEPAQFEPEPPPIPLPNRPAALATPVVTSPPMPLAVTTHTAEHEGPATHTAEHEGPATPTAEHDDRGDGPSAA